jgi:cytochrome c553
MAQVGQPQRQSRRAAIAWTVAVGLLTTLGAVFAFRGEPLVTAPRQEPIFPPPAEGPVQTLVLPHESPDLPPGPHRDSTLTACTICHSTQLVLNQPPFPRAKWAEVVHKMVAVYGAPIPPEEEPRLVDYLTSVRGR